MSAAVKSGDGAPHLRPGEEGRQSDQAILDAVHGIRFGSVEVVIHDSRVVQIVRTEKARIEDVRGRSR